MRSEIIYLELLESNPGPLVPQSTGLKAMARMPCQLFITFSHLVSTLTHLASSQQEMSTFRKLLKPNAVPSLNLLPNEIIVDVATVERLQSQQPQVSKRGRKRKAVGGGSESDAGRFISTGTNVEEDSDVDLYEAEFDLNDQKYIRKGASFFTIVELL